MWFWNPKFQHILQYLPDVYVFLKDLHSMPSTPPRFWSITALTICVNWPSSYFCVVNMVLFLGTNFYFVCYIQNNQVASLESFKLDCNISASFELFKEKYLLINFFKTCMNYTCINFWNFVLFLLRSVLIKLKF